MSLTYGDKIIVWTVSQMAEIINTELAKVEEDAEVDIESDLDIYPVLRAKLEVIEERITRYREMGMDNAVGDDFIEFISAFAQFLVQFRLGRSRDYDVPNTLQLREDQMVYWYCVDNIAIICDHHRPPYDPVSMLHYLKQIA